MTQEIMLSEKDAFDFSEFQKEAIKRFKGGEPLTGRDGVLTPLIKQIVEASLEGEIEHHMEQCDRSGVNNRRNGKTAKRLQTGIGPIDLETPRDRTGTFEPQIIKKRQTVLNESLDSKVLGLYSLGMSYQSIRGHMQEMYGTEISQGLLTKITDKLLPIITEWRNRPLDAIYPVVFLDAMFFKVREHGKQVTKVVYNLLGINQLGHKAILGFYLSESEGAHFWLGVLNDLKARGVQDILIACIDGLSGFSEAIESAFPKTEIQLCVVHQIRNSLKYVAYKDQKTFMNDLKLVYKADTQALAEQHLLELDEVWGKKYPLVIKSWQTKWDSLSI